MACTPQEKYLWQPQSQPRSRPQSPSQRCPVSISSNSPMSSSTFSSSECKCERSSDSPGIARLAFIYYTPSRSGALSHSLTTPEAARACVMAEQQLCRRKPVCVCVCMCENVCLCAGFLCLFNALLIVCLFNKAL